MNRRISKIKIKIIIINIISYNDDNDFNTNKINSNKAINSNNYILDLSSTSSYIRSINTNSNNITVSAMVRDNVGNKTAYLIKDALIVQGGTTVLLGGEQKLVLKTGDNISVTSSLANSADVIVSVLELT